MNFKKLYNDPTFAAAFTGKQRFYKTLKSKNKKLKFKLVNNGLKGINSYTLHKPVNKPKLYRRIYTKGIKYLFQIDMVDMKKFQDGLLQLLTILAKKLGHSKGNKNQQNLLCM